MKHLEITIRGKVQGVYFRSNTQKVAKQLGVSGIVMNMPDGSVQIQAEGDEEKLYELIAWCRNGPERAQVESVETTEKPVQGYIGFTIRNYHG